MNADYSRIKAAARRRVLDSRNRRAETMTRVLFDNDPLSAEPVLQRRVDHIKRRMGVGTAVAAAIAKGVDPHDIETLTNAQVQIALALQGKTVDFHDVVFVERSRKAANAVGRLLGQDEQALGTCFMISPDLLITNNHVLPTKEKAEACTVQFNFERDGDGGDRDVTTFTLNPASFYETDARTHLDFSVIALGDPVAGTLKAADLGFCPISPAKNKHALGTFVNIIQHPQGTHKKVVMRENLLIHRGRNVLLYTTDTGDGSSGSPVFNDQWQVVAVHHTGGISDAIQLENGVVLPNTVNEGVRASRIAIELFSRRGTLAAERQKLLDAAVSPDEIDSKDKEAKDAADKA